MMMMMMTVGEALEMSVQARGKALPDLVSHCHRQSWRDLVCQNFLGQNIRHLVLKVRHLSVQILRRIPRPHRTCRGRRLRRLCHHRWMSHRLMRRRQSLREAETAEMMRHHRLMEAEMAEMMSHHRLMRRRQRRMEAAQLQLQTPPLKQRPMIRRGGHS